MKKANVILGGVYIMKVSDRIARVRLTAISPYGGWVGKNEQTGREIRIRSAQRLRHPATAAPDAKVYWLCDDPAHQRRYAAPCDHPEGCSTRVVEE